MLFIKELKKICFSFIYVLFIGLLLFSWHENFYGVTTKEITGSQGNEVLIALSVVVYNKKRGGKLNYDFFLQKHFGFFKDRFTAHIQK